MTLDEEELDELDRARRIVSYSELDTFRQCPLKHNLGYQQRWTKPVEPDGALAKGTLWHLVMETHYRVLKADPGNGKSRTDRAGVALIKKARRAVEPLLCDSTTGEQTDPQKLIEWMYDGYVQKWGWNDDWKILATEHNVKATLLDEDGQLSDYDLKAKMDLLVYRLDLGTRWVVDHKSGADLPSQQDLEFDDQFGLYTWLMRRVGRPVQGSLHNAARTTRNKGDVDPGEEQPKGTKRQTLDQRFKHSLISRGEQELTNLALDAFRAAQAAYPPPGMVRSLYSSPDPRSCGWKCDFRTAHLLMRSGTGSPNQILLDQGFRVDRTRH